MSHVVVATIALATTATTAPSAASSTLRTSTWRVDGVAMHGDELLVDAEVGDALDRCAQQWRVEYPDDPVVESRVDSWRVLGQRAGNRYRTAQFRREAPGRTRVLLAVRELGPAIRSAAPGLPLPRAARVLRELAFDDGPRRAVQLYAVVPGSRSAVDSAARAAARRDGWEPVASTGPDRAHGDVSAWRRAREELLIVVGEAGDATTLLLHATHAPPAPAGGVR